MKLTVVCILCGAPVDRVASICEDGDACIERMRPRRPMGFLAAYAGQVSVVQQDDQQAQDAGGTRDPEAGGITG